MFLISLVCRIFLLPAWSSVCHPVSCEVDSIVLFCRCVVGVTCSLPAGLHCAGESWRGRHSAVSANEWLRWRPLHPELVPAGGRTETGAAPVAQNHLQLGREIRFWVRSG